MARQGRGEAKSEVEETDEFVGGWCSGGGQFGRWKKRTGENWYIDRRRHFFLCIADQIKDVYKF